MKEYEHQIHNKANEASRLKFELEAAKNLIDHMRSQ